MDRRIIPIGLPFNIHLSPDVVLDRIVHAYLILGDTLVLVDTGVAGTVARIESAVNAVGRDIAEIGSIVLTHSHPDHIGGAAELVRRTGAKVLAHAAERAWIEDTSKQARERPVPGFNALVGGSVQLDQCLEDGDILHFGRGLDARALHTPGHSPGSISLIQTEQGIAISGDLIPQPAAMPIYDDVNALAHSLIRLRESMHLRLLCPSWTEPAFGSDAETALLNGIRMLVRVHEVVLKVNSECGDAPTMERCRQCVARLGLPPFAVNPLVARSFAAHLEPGVDDVIEKQLKPQARG